MQSYATCAELLAHLGMLTVQSAAKVFAERYQ
jgi:hypothetical protein